jgi:hypothetical protein
MSKGIFWDTDMYHFILEQVEFYGPILMHILFLEAPPECRLSSFRNTQLAEELQQKPAKCLDGQEKLTPFEALEVPRGSNTRVY